MARMRISIAHHVVWYKIAARQQRQTACLAVIFLTIPLPAIFSPLVTMATLGDPDPQARAARPPPHSIYLLPLVPIRAVCNRPCRQRPHSIYLLPLVPIRAVCSSPCRQRSWGRMEQSEHSSCRAYPGPPPAKVEAWPISRTGALRMPTGRATSLPEKQTNKN